MVVTQKPASFPSLTSHIQLCLAHYCDLHGPTPLMVTEGLPVPCSQCYEDASISERPHTSAANGSQPSVADALRKMTLSSPRSSSVPVSDQDAQAHRAAILQKSKKQTTTLATHISPVTASAIETPPQSPNRVPEATSETNGAKSSNRHDNRHDSSFRRTYDDYVTKRANPCQNCALTLPKRQESKPSKDKNTTATDSKSELRGPTLRTRAPYAHVLGGHDHPSPPNSNSESSCTSDAEDDVSPKDTIRPPHHDRRPTTSTSRSSISSRSSVAQHTHYLDYTSTHEPLVPNTYSIVRASCLRTLSFETLPRRPESSQSGSTLSSPTSAMPPSFPSPPPTSYNSNSSGYITSVPTPQSAASNGGPIFFGDPLAGYTTAYIFRIPDMHARGRKRVYAFLALSTHRERLAMKTFSLVSAAFRDLAAWIQELAEAQAEREREREEESGSAVAALNAAYGNGNGGFGIGGPRDSGVGLGLGGGSIERDRERGNETSFLSGGRGHGFVHRMGGSMGPGGFAPKARGLAELVGLPDFFIELHTRFVRILFELDLVLGS